MIGINIPTSSIYCEHQFNDGIYVIKDMKTIGEHKMIGIDISIPTMCCECQFNDGEDLCYIDGTYAIKDMKTKPSWCPLIDLHMNNKELHDSIERLSELHSNYNCFDEKEQPYYHALSDAIEIFKKSIKK